MSPQGSISCLVVLVLNSGLLNASIKNYGQISEDLPLGLNSRNLNTQELISSYGYIVETHHVVTSDGYILELLRIPYARGQTSATGPRPPVFMMHGLMAASQCYVAIGPDLSPGCNIADAGFDVWLGNARGNRNSRAHTHLNPSNRDEKFKFFDFTWEEIAKYDVSAMIDYVLEQTGREKLHYIGHSQGGTVFLVLNSVLPKYNAKIASAHLMAGVGHQNYFPNRVLAAAAARVNTIYATTVRLGIVEVYPPLEEWLPIGSKSDDCTGMGHAEICERMEVKDLMHSLEVSTQDQIRDDGMGFGGASMKQVAHYGQNIQAKVFRSWDYGLIGNLAQYGSLTPPKYDLSRITANVTMHYTVSDVLLDERDVLAMAEVMPNTKVRRVARDSFTHSDFLIARDAKELVTDYIVAALIRDEYALSTDHENDIGPEIDVPINSSPSVHALRPVLTILSIVMYSIFLYNKHA